MVDVICSIGILFFLIWPIIAYLNFAKIEANAENHDKKNSSEWKGLWPVYMCLISAGIVYMGIELLATRVDEYYSLTVYYGGIILLVSMMITYGEAWGGKSSEWRKKMREKKHKDYIEDLENKGHQIPIAKVNITDSGYTGNDFKSGMRGYFISIEKPDGVRESFYADVSLPNSAKWKKNRGPEYGNK